MQTYAFRGATVVACAITAGIVVWGLANIVGVELTLKPGAPMDEVGLFDVILASGIGGLAAWAVHALLVRLRKARYWPLVGTTALAISVIGPNWMADGASAAALIAMHVCVGLVLIAGLVWASAGKRHPRLSARA